MTSKEKSFGKVHVPYGEDGKGHYSLATKGCFDVIENATPLCVNALQKVGVPSSHLVIADYGTADGGTSMPLISTLIRDFRSRHPNKEVMIAYEDQPNNDFKSLFFYVQGIRDLDRSGYSQSFLKEFKDVYVSVSGTTFFEQCFPSNTVHLGMSFTAMHWLSAKPCDITTGVHMTQAKGKEKEAFAAQAAKDWESLLHLRAKELAPGGKFVIVNFCVDANNHFLGTTDKPMNMYENFNLHWSAMRDEGKITPEEYNKATILNYYRNDEEMKKPFQEGCPVYDAGLRLVSSETRVTRCPYNENYKENGGDKLEAAKGIVGTTRTWSNSSFLTALDSSRPEAERKALVDEFYQRYEMQVAKDPSIHHMDYVHHYIVLEKIVA